MPLQFKPGLTKEHVSSSISYQPLNRGLAYRFARRFEIPDDIPIFGMVFDNLATVDTILRDQSLLPLVQSHNLDPARNNGPMRPVEFNLPQEVFETGTLTLASESENHFQAVLNFDKYPNSIIQLETAPKRSNNLMMILSNACELAALPGNVLTKVQKRKPFVLIQQGIPREDDAIGYLHSGFTYLQKEGEDGVIKASETNLSGTGGDYWALHVDLCKKIVSQSSGVFFMLDGYYPPTPKM